MNNNGIVIFVGDLDLDQEECVAVVKFWLGELERLNPDRSRIDAEIAKWVKKLCEVLSGSPVRHPGYWPTPASALVSDIPVTINGITLPPSYAAAFLLAIQNFRMLGHLPKLGLSKEKYELLFYKIAQLS